MVVVEMPAIVTARAVSAADCTDPALGTQESFTPGTNGVELALTLLSRVFFHSLDICGVVSL